MLRAAFFIDGFNLYHAISGADFPRRFRWLDLAALSRRFLASDEQLQSVSYYTALPTWDDEKTARHQTYIRAVRTAGVTVRKGHFNPRTKQIYVNQNLTLRYRTHEEKRSDVALAIDLVRMAYEDTYDVGVVISADGDMQPAIETVLEQFPLKSIRIVFPPNRGSQQLSRLGCRTIKMIPADIQQSLFPLALVLPTGRLLHMPPEWA